MAHINVNGGPVLVTSSPTWNTETLMSASSQEKGGCGMSIMIYMGETMPDATPRFGRREKSDVS